MPKVIGPLLSQDARGRFGHRMIFKRGGIVVNYFKPRNPNSAAQQAQREAFRSLYVPGLTQEQADLLYSAISHLHDNRYSQLGHQHNDLYSLLSHLHDDRYSQLSHEHGNTASECNALGATFNITGNAGVFQDTGLSVSLPSAGTYELFADVRGLVRGNAGSAWYISAELYNSTDSIVVPNSERLVCIWYTTGVYVQNTVPIRINYTVTGAKTIKLYAARNGNSTPTWHTSAIYSEASGRTVLGYKKISN